MTNLWIDTNHPASPRFAARPSFFNVDYDVPGPLAARMLAAQAISDTLAGALMRMSTNRMSTIEAQLSMESLWHAIEEIVRPFVGASAETKQRAKDTAVPTSARLPEASSLMASRSSTKRKAIQSLSALDEATPAEGAGDKPF